MVMTPSRTKGTDRRRLGAVSRRRRRRHRAGFGRQWRHLVMVRRLALGVDVHPPVLRLVGGRGADRVLPYSCRVSALQPGDSRRSARAVLSVLMTRRFAAINDRSRSLTSIMVGVVTDELIPTTHSHR